MNFLSNKASQVVDSLVSINRTEWCHFERMNETAARLRIQAAQCRRLADDIAERDNSIAIALVRMADEFDAKAGAIEQGDTSLPRSQLHAPTQDS